MNRSIQSGQNIFLLHHHPYVLCSPGLSKPSPHPPWVIESSGFYNCHLCPADSLCPKYIFYISLYILSVYLLYPLSSSTCQPGDGRPPGVTQPPPTHHLPPPPPHTHTVHRLSPTAPLRASSLPSASCLQHIEQYLTQDSLNWGQGIQSFCFKHMPILSPG